MEIYEQSQRKIGQPQIRKDLRPMRLRQRFTGFELEQQLTLHDKVSPKTNAKRNSLVASQDRDFTLKPQRPLSEFDR
jgi:hypothetical protein